MYEIIVRASEIVHRIRQILTDVDLPVRVRDPIYVRHSSKARATERGELPVALAATAIPVF